MRHPRRTRRLLGVGATIVVLAGLGGFIPVHPAVAQGADEAVVPVTIIYTTDVKGHIEPCG